MIVFAIAMDLLQSKLAQEHLLIPRIYYPWIRGPFNETMEALTAETGAKINIPPPSAANEVIVVTGEKEGVHKAAAAIRKIYEDVKASEKTVTCQVHCFPITRFVCSLNLKLNSHFKFQSLEQADGLCLKCC